MSRDLANLHPSIRPKVDKFLLDCANAGITLLVTCTSRTNAEQAMLYAQSRTQVEVDAAGVNAKARPDLPWATNAKPGQSKHNFESPPGTPASLAVDVVPLRDGKPVWSTVGSDGKLWEQIGAIGEACGLEWGGRWPGKKRDRPHFQGSAVSGVAA